MVAKKYKPNWPSGTNIFIYARNGKYILQSKEYHVIVYPKLIFHPNTSICLLYSDACKTSSNKPFIQSVNNIRLALQIYS